MYVRYRRSIVRISAGPELNVSASGSSSSISGDADAVDSRAVVSMEVGAAKAVVD